MSRLLRPGARWLVLLLLGLAAGCATVPDDDRESELPWSKPQSWEGVIPMPGFDGR